MTSAARHKDGVASSLARLKLNDASGAKRRAAKPKKQVADSWEDDDDDDDDDETGQLDTAPSSATSTMPAAPPPTPMSPHFSHPPPGWDSPVSGAEGAGAVRAAADGAAPARRPEKTDAVARRMITAGLGLKAPKQTEEQKAYQRSIREQERKRRDHDKEQERKRQEEAERAKAAVWDD